MFALGLLAGLALDAAVAPAEASKLDWEAIAKEPPFRAAVIEVIDACIVDNGIIYCN
jgi:hypothetical protein